MSFDRRSLLRLGLAAAGAGLSTGVAKASSLEMLVGARSLDVMFAPRELYLYNLHTDETFKEIYWANGDYLPDALSGANHFLRDFRANETHPMDPGLLDLVHTLHQAMSTDQPFQVVSGYRSPSTNAMLAQEGPGVATKSFHMQGMAMDICMDGMATQSICQAALTAGRGGVGYYPGKFVHVDVGPVRRWSGPEPTPEPTVTRVSMHRPTKHERDRDHGHGHTLLASNHGHGLRPAKGRRRRV